MRTTLFLLAASCGLRADERSPGLPLVFIANQGQAPANVRFMVKGSGLTAFFTADEARFRAGGSSLRVRFEGARPGAEVEGVERLPGKANFLTGNEQEWRLGVALYGGIVYRGLYPGIDMRYGGAARKLKSEFVVAPGADPAAIRMRYEGAAAVRLEDGGELVVGLADGRELREEAPVLYQERGGRRVSVDGRFAVADGVVSFIVNGYDAALPLVIDPVLSYSTLLGGAGSDAITGLVVDGSGTAYVAGFTASYDLPTANPTQSFDAGGNDGFIARLNAAGNGLIYCTYLGGRSDDRIYAIAVDAAGAAYVTGSTTSTNFPLRGALQTKLGGSKSAFAAKLNAAGNGLLYSTYLGGSGADTGNAIAVDAAGSAYVAGVSTSLNLPTSGVQRTNRGSQDGFVAKFSADGSRLVYSTYLGGTGDDQVTGIAVDAGGTAYVTGWTWSGNFPLAAAYQGAAGGGQDAFAARLSADGNALLWSTYLGGGGGALGAPEAGQAVAVDGQGNAYVAGATSSANFPVVNGLQATLRGSGDAFVAKFSAAGALAYSTYLGGTGVDAANAVALDGSGNVYVAGQTFSSDLGVTGAFQTTAGGDYDAFAARLSAAGGLVWLSYLGGSGSDTATSVAADGAGGVYVAGWTLSANFPVLNGYQASNAGTYGGFVAKVGASGGAPPAVVGVTPNTGSGTTQTFSLQFSDAAGATGLTTVAVLVNGSANPVNACSVTYTRAANTLALLTDGGAAPAGTITPGSGSQQNSQCTLNGAGSSVSLAGNVLTLNLALTFQPGFAGTRTVYLQASNAFGATGWQSGGTWTIPAGAPAPVSVTPGSGSGSTQTFTFVFSEPKGYGLLALASIVFNSSLSGGGACYLLYYPSNTLYLVNDSGVGTTGPVTPGQSGTLQNSQCSVNAAGSAASGSGNTLTLTLALTFTAGFAGAKNIYLDAYDGLDSGWQQKGTWTVTAPAPSPVSVTPGTGSGSTQTFTFVFSEPKGYGLLTLASIVFNSSLSGGGACYLLYYPNKTLYLVNDSGVGTTGPVTPGQSGTLQNSQCSVSAAGSAASGSGNTLTLTLALTFTAGFAGAKNIYMDAFDGLDSGWQQKGTWTVTAGAPSPVSVTPGSGSGSTQTFTFVFSEPKGYTALSLASIVFNGSLSGGGACYLLYYPNNTLYLVNDSGVGWTGPLIPGQSQTLQNSQCTVNGAVSWASGSGNTLTLALSLSFRPGFAGAKNIYMDAYDGVDSGWQQKGTWTVP